jgi:hypothetical protein
MDAIYIDCRAAKRAPENAVSNHGDNAMLFELESRHTCHSHHFDIRRYVYFVADNSYRRKRRESDDEVHDWNT